MTLPGYFCEGEGPAVLLLHCSLSSKGQWRGLSSLLARDFRVVAVDLYGYGDTPMPEEPEGFTLLDEVELVRALLEGILPEQSFHVVGHSYGAATALSFARCHPARVRALTLFEPVSFHLLEQGDPALEPVLGMMRELEGFLGAGLTREAAGTFVDYWSGAGAFARYPARMQDDFARRSGKLLLDFKALTGTPFTLEDYRQLKLPVTLMAGRGSRIPSLRVTERLSQTLPESRLVWLETGHMGPVTDPALVNPVILQSVV